LTLLNQEQSWQFISQFDSEVQRDSGDADDVVHFANQRGIM
jgi:hypothetical protein